jgi:hypothetical protein
LMANVESAVSSMSIAFTGILIITIIEQRTLKLNEVEALDSKGNHPLK